MARFPLANRKTTVAAAAIASALGATTLEAQAYQIDTDAHTITFDKSRNNPTGAVKFLKRNGVEISLQSLMDLNGNPDPTKIMRGAVWTYAEVPAVAAAPAVEETAKADAVVTAALPAANVDTRANAIIELEAHMAELDAIEDAAKAKEVQVAAAEISAVQQTMTDAVEGSAATVAVIDPVAALEWWKNPSIGGSTVLKAVEDAVQYAQAETAATATDASTETVAPAAETETKVDAPAAATTGEAAPAAAVTTDAEQEASMCKPLEENSSSCEEGKEALVAQMALLQAQADKLKAAIEAIECDCKQPEAVEPQPEPAPVPEEPKAEEPVPQQPEKLTYTVVGGDNLCEFAEAHDFSAMAIFEQNPHAFGKTNGALDPHNLKEGAVLDLTGLVKVQNKTECNDIPARYVKPQKPRHAGVVTGGNSGITVRTETRCETPTLAAIGDDANRKRAYSIYKAHVGANDPDRRARAALAAKAFCTSSKIVDHGGSTVIRDGSSTNANDGDNYSPGGKKRCDVRRFKTMSGEYAYELISNAFNTCCQDQRVKYNGKWVWAKARNGCEGGEGPGGFSPPGDDNGSGGCSGGCGGSGSGIGGRDADGAGNNGGNNTPGGGNAGAAAGSGSAASDGVAAGGTGATGQDGGGQASDADGSAAGGAAGQAGGNASDADSNADAAPSFGAVKLEDIVPKEVLRLSGYEFRMA